jgi:hypothetical protein
VNLCISPSSVSKHNMLSRLDKVCFGLTPSIVSVPAYLKIRVVSLKAVKMSLEDNGGHYRSGVNL